MASWGNLRCSLLIFTAMVVLHARAIGQAPSISYQTPQSYTVNTTINALLPVNTGGVVPPDTFLNVSTVAGNINAGAVNGLSAAARFNSPAGITVGPQGIVYVADNNNHQIRQISTSGMVSTLAGTGLQGYNDGPGITAKFYSPFGVVTDAIGNVYVADCLNNMIRAITPAGFVSTLAGSYNPGYADNIGINASFFSPIAIAIDPANNLYIADSGNDLIRKVTAAGVVTTLAGVATKGGATNGPASSATFKQPYGVVLDKAGNIYVADYANNMIRKISTSGIVSTFAGSLKPGNADGQDTLARFNAPFGIAIDATGNLYVADSKNNLLRKISPTGYVSTIAGNGNTGATDGVATAATFNDITGVAADTVNNCLYIADQRNNLIRKVSLNGYYIDKLLPAGLTFDSKTGAITGTPTVVSPATDYTITAYNNSGFSSTLVNIQVNTVPVVLPPTINKTLCDADFSDIATGGISTIKYLVNDPSVATITQNGLVHIVGPGTTTIAATDGYSTAQQTLTVSATGTISISASGNHVLTGATITFTAILSGNLSTGNYQWAVNGVNVAGNSATFTTSALKNNDVVLCTFTPATGCTTPLNSNAITLSIYTPIKVIPNTFTPNGDGYNDTWDLSAIQSQYPNITVSVYNRNGTKVFYQAGYNSPWDGTCNGKPLPVATYYYLIDAGTQKFSGTVAIIR